jgi:hypothetical protein
MELQSLKRVVLGGIGKGAVCQCPNWVAAKVATLPRISIECLIVTLIRAF